MTWNAFKKVSMIKKSDKKDIDSVAERKGESKKRIISEIKDENLNNFEKKKLDERTKDLESLSKDIANGFNLDFEELGATLNTQTSEIRRMPQQLKHVLMMGSLR